MRILYSGNINVLIALLKRQLELYGDIPVNEMMNYEK